MRLLAISDMYIPSGYMADGLGQLREVGIDVEVRAWEHETLIDLQEDNLAIERLPAGSMRSILSLLSLRL